MNESPLIPGTSRQRVAKSKPAYKRFYATAQWEQLRQINLSDEPICRLCGKPATTIDHLDGDNTHNTRCNLQSLDYPCHAWKSNKFEKRIRLANVETLTDFRDWIKDINLAGVFVRPQFVISQTQFIQSFFGTLILALESQTNSHLRLWRDAAMIEIASFHSEYSALLDNALYQYDLSTVPSSVNRIHRYIQQDIEKTGILYPSVLRYAMLLLQWELKK